MSAIPMPNAQCPIPYAHEYIIFLRKAIVCKFSRKKKLKERSRNQEDIARPTVRKFLIAQTLAEDRNFGLRSSFCYILPLGCHSIFNSCSKQLVINLGKMYNKQLSISAG